MSFSWQSSVLIGIATTLAVIAAVSSVPVETMAQATMAVADSNSLLDSSALTEAINAFQRFEGLTANGDLDDESLQLSSGYRDKIGSGFDSRSKRNVPQGNRWPVKDLTYKITKYSKHLDHESVDREIARAFAVWSEYTDLSFTVKASGPVNIEIRFVDGDDNLFDIYTLANNFVSYPNEGGYVHFNDDVNWSINTMDGQNVFQIAVHEFGSLLGLPYSNLKSSVMYLYASPYNPDFKLDSEDVQRIQALYGRKTVV